MAFVGGDVEEGRVVIGRGGGEGVDGVDCALPAEGREGVSDGFWDYRGFGMGRGGRDYSGRFWATQSVFSRVSLAIIIILSPGSGCEASELVLLLLWNKAVTSALCFPPRNSKVRRKAVAIATKSRTLHLMALLSDHLKSKPLKSRTPPTFAMFHTLVCLGLVVR